MSEQLIYEAQRGNQDALARLLYDNYNIVFKYLIKFTLNRNIAEDLAQETMVRAVEKVELYKPEKAKFSTWLITIAQHMYIDYLRKQKHENKYIEVEDAASILDELPQEQDESWGNALEALSHLSEDVRFPLIMKHYHGYSYEEIAQRMSIPLGTVKSRIHNGLNALRKELGLSGGK